MSNIYLERLRAISGEPMVQEPTKPTKPTKGHAIHGMPAVQEPTKPTKGAYVGFVGCPTTGIAENALCPPPDDRTFLEADVASQVAAAEVLHLAAHPDRTAFALKNHADAIRHFRKMAADTERLALMYRAKIEAHINEARKRVNPAEFAAWLGGLAP